MILLLRFQSAGFNRKLLKAMIANNKEVMLTLDK